MISCLHGFIGMCGVIVGLTTGVISDISDSARSIELVPSRSVSISCEDVKRCLYSPNGCLVGVVSARLTASTDTGEPSLLRAKYRVIILDLRTGQRREFSNDCDLDGLAFSSDSKFCVAWSINCKNAVIFSVESLNIVEVLDFGEIANAPTTIAFSDGDTGLFLGNRDGSVDFRDLRMRISRRIVDPGTELGAIKGICVTPTGGRFLALTYSGVAEFHKSGGKAIRTYNLESGIEFPACSADSNTIVSIHSQGPFESDSKRIVMWRRDLGSSTTPSTTLRTDASAVKCDAIEKGASIIDHAVSSDGKWYCVLGAEGHLGIGCLKTRSDIKWFQIKARVNSLHKRYMGYALAFSPRNDEFAVIINGDSELRILRIAER